MKFSICLDTFLKGKMLKELLGEIKEQTGFEFVEFWDWRNKDLKSIKDIGFKISNFSGNRRFGPSITRWKEFKKELSVALKIANELGVPYVMLLSDALNPDGFVSSSNLSRERRLVNVYDNLLKATRLAEDKGIILVLEMLNSVKDHRGYTLDSWDVTRDLVSAINSSHLRILLDIYHLQMQQGNIINTIKRDIEYVGYVHVANPPLRCEPWEGELNYIYILNVFEHIGYSGFVGFEFFPSKEFKMSKLWNWCKSSF